MSLYAAAKAIEATPVSAAIRESTWFFPALEAVPLLALALLGGSLLMLDLNLLGVGLKPHAPAIVEGRARPWLSTAAAVFTITGLLLGLSEAVKLNDRPAFWVKMTALLLALLFTYAVRMPAARRLKIGSGAARLVAVCSLAVWLTVALAGRWIGFS